MAYLFLFSMWKACDNFTFGFIWNFIDVFFIIASNNSLNNNSDEIGYIYMVHKCQIIDYITTKKRFNFLNK